jgi:hypothetical protein
METLHGYDAWKTATPPHCEPMPDSQVAWECFLSTLDKDASRHIETTLGKVTHLEGGGLRWTWELEAEKPEDVLAALRAMLARFENH